MALVPGRLSHVDTERVLLEGLEETGGGSVGGGEHLHSSFCSSLTVVARDVVVVVVVVAVVVAVDCSSSSLESEHLMVGSAIGLVGVVGGLLLLELVALPSVPLASTPPLFSLSSKPILFLG